MVIRAKTRRSLSHPLVDKRGHVRRHRLNLWDKIGGGEHACHWCGRTVEWRIKGDVRHPNSAIFLVADHLDGNIRNDSPENLVASCRGCNTLRESRYKRIPQGERSGCRRPGKTFRVVGANCAICGKEFFTRPVDLRRGARFCSHQCSSAGRRVFGITVEQKAKKMAYALLAA